MRDARKVELMIMGVAFAIGQGLAHRRTQRELHQARTEVRHLRTQLQGLTLALTAQAHSQRPRRHLQAVPHPEPRHRDTTYPTSPSA